MADQRIVRYDRLDPSKTERKAFDCGDQELNAWLVRYARQNMDEGNAVVYLLSEDRRILGYYSLSAGTVSRADATAIVGRQAPDPIPAVLLGRLAVDRSAQGRTLGSRMLGHAVRQSLATREVIGARCLIVHCLTDDVTRFYKDRGFDPSPISPRTLMLPLADVVATLNALTGEG